MEWTQQFVNKNMTQSANPLTEDTTWIDNMTTPVTPTTNPELWYQWYAVLKEDAPEIMDQFVENTAAKMELTVDYFVAEFLPNE